MAQGLLRIVKQRYPDSQIDMVAPAWSKTLLQRMPEVDQCLYVNFPRGQLKLRARIAIGQQLRSNYYSQAFVLPNSFKSAIIPMVADIPVRTGWRGEMRYVLLNDIRLPSKKRYPMMLQRYAALAYPAGATLPADLPYPHLHTTPETVTVTIKQLKLDAMPSTMDKTQTILAIAPGAAYGPSKRWPMDYFVRLIAHQVQAKQQHIWLLGNQQDREMTQAIVQASIPAVRPYVQDLAGRTSLDQAIDLISRADYVVTHDSGLMHLAAALKKKQVALFGSSSPVHTPPLNHQARTLWLQLPCSPCFQRTCRFKHFHCMRQLMPEQVITALEELATDPEGSAKSF